MGSKLGNDPARQKNWIKNLIRQNSGEKGEDFTSSIHRLEEVEQIWRRGRSEWSLVSVALEMPTGCTSGNIQEGSLGSWAQSKVGLR